MWHEAQQKLHVITKNPQKYKKLLEDLICQGLCQVMKCTRYGIFDCLGLSILPFYLHEQIGFGFYLFIFFYLEMHLILSFKKNMFCNFCYLHIHFYSLVIWIMLEKNI